MVETLYIYSDDSCSVLLCLVTELRSGLVSFSEARATINDVGLHVSFRDCFIFSDL